MVELSMGMFVTKADYWQARAEAAERALAEAKKALEPFAVVVERAERANAHFGGTHASDVPDDREYGVLGVTWGHLRAASRALTGGQDDD